MKHFIEKNSRKILFIIILIGLLFRLSFLLDKGIAFWDTGVYIGIGKYIFSLGQIGVFEALRPPLFSLILGFFWFIKLNPLIFGNILIMAVSLASIYLTYLIAKKILNKEIGLIAAFLLAINVSHSFFSAYALGDNLSTFLVLLSFYFFICEKKYFLTGLFAAFSFLTRFTNGLVIFSIFVFSVYEFIKNYLSLYKTKNQNFLKIIRTEKMNKLIKKYFILFLGFIIPVVIYLITNYIFYDNILLPFIQASRIISIVAEHFSKGVLFYPLNLLKENFLSILFLVSIPFLFTKKLFKSKHYKYLLLILFYIFITFVYYSARAHKEFRYVTVVLPFIFVFMGLAASKLIELYNHKLAPKIYDKRKLLAYVALIGLFLLLTCLSIILLKSYGTREIDSDVYTNFYNREIKYNNIIVSSPRLVIYQDIKPTIIYETITNKTFNNMEKNKPDAYFLEMCDLFDPTKEEINKDLLLKDISNYYKLEYNKTVNSCEYYIFVE